MYFFEKGVARLVECGFEGCRNPERQVLECFEVSSSCLDENCRRNAEPVDWQGCRVAGVGCDKKTGRLDQKSQRLRSSDPGVEKQDLEDQMRNWKNCDGVQEKDPRRTGKMALIK